MACSLRMLRDTSTYINTLRLSSYRLPHPHSFPYSRRPLVPLVVDSSEAGTEANEVFQEKKSDDDHDGDIAARIRLEFLGCNEKCLNLWFDKLLKVEETKSDLKNVVLNVVISGLSLGERSGAFTVNVSG